ncbi:carbamate kinase [Pseudoxanthomonas sacheonensis]|uniref:carbamate kinase n=1 Tax=Pseudoxanthomonas sacheonensis TaxID=443615 RepID=UPI0013D62429|nr:carbamate kinase [Pseudoxanthomonas sacheonensis]KAF1708331.1 carbamate kinase [Pseudoxanthomonas sacheonensis]
MRLVIALGGNALLKRGEPLTAENQKRNMQAAAQSLAHACDGNEVALVHGNGPQVGLLALEAEAYRGVPPYPLDLLGAESQGMIGYVIAQALRNERPQREIAALLTRIRVDPGDSAFEHPTKPIGPVYGALEAESLRAAHGWSFAADGDGMRRVVASPRPVEIIELPVIGRLMDAGVVTVCAGGGGIPVRALPGGAHDGIEAVIDKDLAAALLAQRLRAERLVILTDVDAVYLGWRTARQQPLRRIRAADLQLHCFAEGSMAPKVEAACQFALDTGRPAVIGALSQAFAVVAGEAGTEVLP